ncbi:hypothetical protein HDU93_001674 [Gonapodya sp. JEL0774]|nr:hypothetical protein HDU93_001674 [Gonapodya sp. JEL0774]
MNKKSKKSVGDGELSYEATSGKEKNPKISWTEDKSNFLLNLLETSKKSPNAASNGFSPQQWTQIRNSLVERFPEKVNIPMESIDLHYQFLKKKVKAVRDCRKESGFGWDDILCKISAAPGVWERLKLEAHRVLSDSIADSKYAAGSGTAPDTNSALSKSIVEGSKADLDHGYEDSSDDEATVKEAIPIPPSRRDSDISVRSRSATPVDPPVVRTSHSNTRGEKRKAIPLAIEQSSQAVVQAVEMMGAFFQDMGQARKDREQEREAKRLRKLTPLERAIETVEHDGWNQDAVDLLVDLFTSDNRAATAYGTLKNRESRIRVALDKVKKLHGIDLAPPMTQSAVPMSLPFKPLAITSMLGGGYHSTQPALPDEQVGGVWPPDFGQFGPGTVGFHGHGGEYN